ncbi:lysine N(6)-hydroxylase/L-ornithine N(5)-oxygenase family protein [Bergeyella zoohelcum]|uniref:L-lysine 6-monooxygenase n=1 Tax=Bergeyella zoohelcum TaxID=1015 RepID=A0A7Z8YRY1_9FLAO|nr:SidA/IucD/PvdA family monooxygenase [Bergeyella zoohelcum]VDH04962.1 L-lysine 6-monooxygenase [Bergeyella zoohelcum]
MLLTNLKIYDVIGVGIGPFNLGFAALSSSKDMDSLFFDKAPKFDWHKGLMLRGCTLQVPFLADLVTPVEPTNKFSYINYLVAKKKLFKFCIKESFYITRKNYNDYCRWVVAQLSNLRFSHQVETIEYNEEHGFYEVSVHDLIERNSKTYFTKRLVIGTGTIPNVPRFAEICTHERVFHSSQYTYRERYIEQGSTITVVGSGQSAAEIFQDLLNKADENSYQLNWITQEDRFFPMEDSKFTFEFTSPDYLNFFHSLPEDKRYEIIAQQDALYKGINNELIGSIHDQLAEIEEYKGQCPNVHILSSTRLTGLEGSKKEGFELTCHHLVEDEDFTFHSDFVIMATGYKYQEPKFLQTINGRLQRDSRGNLKVDKNFSIDKKGNEVYVLNSELASHGILTADLGMGPYRNATIINHILGEKHFDLETRIAFQDFCIPEEFKK